MEYWREYQRESFEGEEWVKIEGFSNYEISNYGRLKSLNRYRGSHYSEDEYPIIMKQRLCNKGYCVCMIRDDNRKSKIARIHRLVGKSFIPNPYKLPQINHKKGFKTDNRVSELEWISNEENMRHSYEIGLRLDSSRGVMNGRHLVDEKDVIYIYTNPDRKTRTELWNEFNISKSGLGSIYSGKNWSYLTNDLTPHSISVHDKFIKIENTESYDIVFTKGLKSAVNITGISLYLVKRLLDGDIMNDEYDLKYCSYDEWLSYEEVSSEEVDD